MGNRVIPIQWQEGEHVRRRSDPLRQFLVLSCLKEKLVEVYSNTQTRLSRVSEILGIKCWVSLQGIDTWPILMLGEELRT